MKKRSIILLVLGLLLIIVPYFFNVYNIFRLLSLAIGIILVVVSMVFRENRNILVIVLLPILLIFLTYGLDTLLFSKMSRIPIMVKMVESSSKVKTYNSLFYRIYDCGGTFFLDRGYKMNYACNADDLGVLDINDFLREPMESFIKYDDKFVKISGKISKITGVENIELNLYTLAESGLNGYVNFNKNYVVQVQTQENLSNYRIYDNITVIGRVDEIIEANGAYTIILKDTLLIPSDIYDNFSYEMVSSDKEVLVPLIKDKEYYLYGFSSLNIKYDDNNIYELSYLMTDTRITWDMLINDLESESLKVDDEEVLVKYKGEKFNLVDCHNGKKIIVNKSKEIDADTCSIDVVDN